MNTDGKYLNVSGIYPHLAAWNHGDDTSDPYYQEPECGIGAVVPWANRLWFLTYTSHDLYQGDDKLYCVNEQMDIYECPESVGGTHAGRFIHKESEQLFIGCYVIDKNGDVRVIDRNQLPGRLTAIARHLSDPENRVYYYSQECSLYEVDVHTLEVTLLFKKPVAGWHAKGAYMGQGVLVVAHNGEEIAPSPYWQAHYREPLKTIDEVTPYLQTSTTYNPDDMGVLAEWDGNEWREICRNQFNDINSYGGLCAGAPEDAPIWAQGWDKRSVMIKVRENGAWSTWRLPKGSFTYDGWNGSYTEWPRFINITRNQMLMFMHGTLFKWPVTFCSENPKGIVPQCTYQRIIPDITFWKDKLVLAGQDTSRIGIPWTVPGHPHSNIQFTSLETMRHWGPCRGYGQIWKNDPVDAATTSDPFLIHGYENVCIYICHESISEIDFTIELYIGSEWVNHMTVEVPSAKLATVILTPAECGAQWLRASVDADCYCTFSLHLDSARKKINSEECIFDGLAQSSEDANHGILQVPVHNHNLQFLNRKNEYFEINERLDSQQINSSEHLQDVQDTAEIKEHVFEDEASFWAIGADGQRFRFPKSASGLSLKNARDVREVVQERFLANIGSTFYEVPRYGVSEPYDQRNLPDYRRMRPICSHNKAISDYVVWRGLLVLAGAKTNASPDGHVFGGLWYGAFDDLWALGDPTGIGGPWKNSPVAADVPSDPYLMTGFKKKTLELTHKSRKDITFSLEVDIDNTGVFREYAKVTVLSGQTFVHSFQDGFSAHWFRVTASSPTVATAQLTYSA